MGFPIRSSAGRPNAMKDNVIVDPTWRPGQHDANEFLVATDLVSFAAFPCRRCRRSADPTEAPHQVANMRPAIAR
jgi:hypothetical protein